MRIFRVNLKKSMNNFISSGKVTCPTGKHGGWTTLGNSKRGDIFLIANGLKDITHVCYAKADPIVTHVDYFGEPTIEKDTLLLVDLETVYDYRIEPIQANLLNTATNSTTLNSQQFCVELVMLDDSFEKVLKILNRN